MKGSPPPRPLGLSPMSALDAVLVLPADFRWQPGVTPMSDFMHLVYAEIAYFVVIFGLQWWMGPAEQVGKKDSALIKFAMCVHNAFLCLLSAAMCGGAGYEAFLRSQKDGARWLFCEEIGRKPDGGVYFWSYIYYLSKYIEFVDTLFKVLKRKPLDFLHVYHHAVVALMCFNWMNHSQSLQTMGLMFNALVHVIMYFYFALTVYMPPPWWKRYITTFQIIQFQSSFVLALPFFYLQFKDTYLDGGPGCQGATAVYFNAAFNLSLLALFIAFSRKTYSKGRSEGANATSKDKAS